MSAVVLDARICTGTGGGPEKVIFDSARHFEGTPFRKLAAYLSTPGDPGIEVLRWRAAEARCAFIHVPDHGPFDVALLDRMTRLCRTLGVTIWHGHDYKANVLGLLLKRRLGLRLVSTVHGWGVVSPKLRAYYAIDRWALRHYEHVTCVSRDLYETCLASGVPEERLHLIENGIDTEQYRRFLTPREARGGTTPEGRIVIGAIGRLSPEKGFDLLVEAVDRLVEGGLELELWIAGEGPERHALEAQIARLKNPERIRLLGYRTDTIQLLEKLDIYALSSLREGLPQVLLEAMAMKVPCVATRCGGVESVVRHEREALLCDPGSVVALSVSLGRLAASPLLRRMLAERARRRVEEDFRFERRVKAIQEIYERLQ